MRTCPACDSNDVRITALFAAAVHSTSRCGACGSGLKFNWVSGILSTIAFSVGLWAGLTFSSLSIGVTAGVLAWTTVLLSPLRIDETDPIAFRKKLRETAKRQREDTSGR